MDIIEEYFQGEYIVEKNRIKEIDDLVIDVLETLTGCKHDMENGYPYVLSNDKDGGFESSKKYSFSTNSMIIFVLAKLSGHIDINSPLLPSIEWDLNKNQNEDINKICINKYYELISSECKKIVGRNNNQDVIVESNSFGNNDPLTLSWLVELFKKKGEEDVFNEIKDKTIEISKAIIKKSFEAPHLPVLNFKDTNNRNPSIETIQPLDIKLDLNGTNNRKSSNHIFPLLRVIYLYKTILNKGFYDSEEKTKISNLLINLLINLQNRINQQISHYTIKNSLFDTAELVMSLEGILLLDEKKRVDENLVKKIFEILEANQKNNLYWRPLKPFVTSPQGDVLLPLSIEVASSLLRICKLLERSNLYFFHNYFDIFNNYSQWLLANVSQCDIKGKTYKGWRSEHVQEQDIIHPWETAQVLTYLMTFKSMIQERIAYKSLKKSGLSCKEMFIGENDKKWNDFFDTGINLGYDNCYKDIYNRFIEKREKNEKSSFSMLLYGPPGTGKSTIAEQLAANLKWRLITITPSDFIKHGESDIEGRAKNIFKTLEEQKDCVILFDEIDRLILDRDSNFYLNQSDFYQFMTPSMLVKFKDLRTKEKSIFIVATNYEERIDSAIKRAGRIDHKYLINTLNKEQRKKLIDKIAAEKNVTTYIETALNDILNQTCFFSYTELQSLLKNAISEFQNERALKDIILDKIKTNPPTIKLSNYKRRFQEDTKITFENDIRDEVKIDSLIYPYKEFLALVYLAKEVETTLKPDEIEIINRIKKIPSFDINEYFQHDSEVYNKIKDLF